MTKEVKVSNVSRVPQVVPIIMADNKRTSINVMPRSRPTLPPGSTVDPNWIALNPGCISILKTEEKSPASTKTNPAPEVESTKEPK